MYCLDIWPESILDVFPSDKSLFYKLVKKWSVSIYKKANLIGVTSQSFIDYFRDDLGIKDITVHYLPQHSDDVKGNDDLQQRIMIVLTFSLWGMLESLRIWIW